MLMYNFTLGCGCSCSNALLTVTNSSLGAWRKVIQNGQIGKLTCTDCGCEHTITESVTEIGVEDDPAKPRIDLIDMITGTVAGGQTATLTGHRLDVGSLVVKFGNATVVSISSRSDSHATIVTPPARLKLMTSGEVVGVLAPGDHITGSLSGKTAQIEEVHIDRGYLIVSSTVGQFTGDEWAQKDGSNMIKLAAVATPLIYAVDVTVSNENGQRVVGGSLVNGFTYA